MPNLQSSPFFNNTAHSLEENRKKLSESGEMRIFHLNTITEQHSAKCCKKQSGISPESWQQRNRLFNVLVSYFKFFIGKKLFLPFAKAKIAVLRPVRV